MGGLNALALSKDQALVATVGQEKRLTLWDLRDQLPVAMSELSPNHDDEVTAHLPLRPPLLIPSFFFFVFSFRSGRTLSLRHAVAAAAAATAVATSFTAGTVVYTESAVKALFRCSSSRLRSCPSPDPQTLQILSPILLHLLCSLLILCGAAVLCGAAAATAAAAAVCPGQALTVAISHDGRWLATGGTGQRVKVWDLLAAVPQGGSSVASGLPKGGAMPKVRREERLRCCCCCCCCSFLSLFPL